MKNLASLVETACSGDTKAFEEIVRRFQDMAYGYAYSILGDFHLAEDAVQEAFVEAYLNLSKLRNASRFPGWFRRIVFHCCDRILRGKKLKTVPLERARNIPSAAPNPYHETQKREMKDKVTEAIHSLSQPLREVTALFYINGYSQNEISEFLEVPVNTVKTRLHSSRKQLKERMIAMVKDTLNEHKLPDGLITVGSSAFKKMIETSMIIRGKAEDQRPHITGVLFESIASKNGRQIRIVSTDGARLSKIDVPCDGATAPLADKGMLIPKKELAEVNKFLDTFGNVQLGLRDKYLVVQKEDETTMVQLMTGDFPAYTDVFRNIDGHKIRMNNRLFSKILKRMSDKVSDDWRVVILSFRKDTLTITATHPDPDIGESKEDITIEYDGRAFDVGFNPRYLLDALDGIDEETAMMTIVDEKSPCLIEGEGNKVFQCAIMPVKLKEA